MPNPLSRISATAQIFDGLGDDNALLPHWRHILTVISAWSKIDTRLSGMLAGFLKADFQVAAAMYEAITSEKARYAALLSAAKAAIPHDCELFQAVIGSMKASKRKRNSFAHHIWGHSPDLPKRALLIDPAAVIENKFAWRQAASDGSLLPKTTQVGNGVMRIDLGPVPVIDRDRILVYSEGQLQVEADNAMQCDEITKLLSRAISSQYPDNEARQILLREPLIQRELQSLQKRNPA
jgi:hypothetical protein